jgi:hypothetical protein
MRAWAGRRSKLGVARGVLLAVTAGIVGAACGSSGGAATTSTTRAPLPAGATPSSISKMVCSVRTHQELDGVLGVTGTVSTPTWADHAYSCRYSYPQGSFVLSVKELSSWAQTYAYFGGLETSLGDTGKATGLGQSAFNTGNGSVVVRKDWKVLLVDISALPPKFGFPATSSADVAYTVADVILGCWNGD